MSFTLPVHLDPILLAFERNTRVNAAMLASIAAEDLGFAAGGGWSICKHLCHLASFRLGWLSVIAPERDGELTPIIEFGDEGEFTALVSHVDEISDAIRAADAVALEVVNQAVAEDRIFDQAYRSHPTDFLMHILVHDAHHRGQIMSLLRQSGRTRTEMKRLEESSWPVWRE